MGRRFRAFIDRPYGKHSQAAWLLMLLLMSACLLSPGEGCAAQASGAKSLAVTPPMGWNDWAHYQCGFMGQTILDNAKYLVSTGLAARGFNTVTIDDCWMLKTRDAQGNLRPDPARFPNGMKPLADAIHALGLKFGIYEDAGSETCGKFAGSGEPNGGGKNHFLQDARLFASWGVDYLKLDGCNVFVPDGGDRLSAYRKAYAAENAALSKVGRPIVFSESAPAYFENTSEWYDVLTWVRGYGQLWREGSDIANYHAKDPDAPRFKSVLWNYAYNLPLGRFQRPGNWDDADFVIAGDSGMSMAESRSQMALWSMMSAPLILSSDVSKLSPEAVAVLGNEAVIAIDQDSLGRMATLVRRTPAVDILLKPLRSGEYAVTALNRSDATAQIQIHPGELGFAANTKCNFSAQNLWNGERQSGLSLLQADVAAHDTEIWRIHPGASCGKQMRTGAIVMTAGRTLGSIDGYTHCLSSSASLEDCAGGSNEGWTIGASGEIRSAEGCLAAGNGQPVMQKCDDRKSQHWRYTLAGNLVNAADHECLTNVSAHVTERPLSMQPCEQNQLNQIWALPN